MFEDDEYRPYVEICRELKLQRKAHEGDWFLQRYCKDQVADSFYMVGQDGLHGSLASPHYDPEQETVWLPRLDQWLTMYRDFGTGFCVWMRPDGWDANVAGFRFEGREEPDIFAAHSAEEAIARLWVAVQDSLARRAEATDAHV